MELTITNAAQAKIAAARKGNETLLLDYDDGVGAYSDVGGCSMTNGFRLLLVAADKRDATYNAQLPSNIGEVYYKDYSEMYLDDKLTIDINPKNASLMLRGANAGELTGLMPIVDVNA